MGFIDDAARRVITEGIRDVRSRQPATPESELERLMRVYGLTRDEAMQALGLGSGSPGGGGGGGSSWNPANVTGDTTATLGQRDKEFQWQSQFDQAQFEWQKSMDERNYALASGDLELAKQKQADANRWQAESSRLEGQRNQTGQFGAETERAVGMGDLALKQNEFIAKMASSPRNHSALFMMQRGLAPDWDTMAAGGKPAQGAALAPTDVMGAYKPVTAPPSFIGQPGGEGPASGGGQMTDTRYRQAPATGGFTRQVMPQSPQIDTAALQRQKMLAQRMAAGGFTTAPVLMTGDAAAPNPEAGGAKPEVTLNPMRAPLFVKPNPDNMRQMTQMMDMGMMPRFALGTEMPGAYAANGMANAWIPTSNNDHLAGMDLPKRMQMLTDYGMPVAPAVASGMTGGVAPTLNLAAAMGSGGLGAGSLPSLQAIRNMSPDEQEALAGYIEGPAGVSMANVVDFIGKGTKHLKTAAQARRVY